MSASLILLHREGANKIFLNSKKQPRAGASNVLTVNIDWNLERSEKQCDFRLYKHTAPYFPLVPKGENAAADIS